MTTYTIPGDPDGIEARAAAMRAEADRYGQVAAGLRSITTDGWTGRAADRFRTRFEVEPGRWDTASTGWRTSATALTTYAGVLRQAQAEAAAATTDHANADTTTRDARAAYDADVARGRAEQQASLAQGIPYDLTILPFTDPGEPLRQAARARYEQARASVEAAAVTAAGQVRTGCAGAPESRNWLETGAAFVGGVLLGAGEAVVDLGKLALSLQWGPMRDLAKLATGELTPEELAMKQRLKWESAQTMLQAATSDPLGFGKEVGKALLDWDTWKDRPDKALGHLVPDAAAAFFTGGTAAAATRGSKGVTALARLGRRTDDVAAGANDVRRVADAAADLSKYDDVYGLEQRLGVPKGDPKWADAIVARHPELSHDGVLAVNYYTTDAGYQVVNGALRRIGPSTANEAAWTDRVSQGLAELPSYEGVTYRGTQVPRSVLDEAERTGSYTDAAFLSTSLDGRVAERFALGAPLKDDHVRTVFEIHGRSGSNVDPFSEFAKDEVEVLFDHHTPFDVVSITDGTDLADPYRKIVLRERPR